MSNVVQLRPDETDDDDPAGFTGARACDTAGISYRQLDYWARTGLAAPSIRPAAGSGSQRLYSDRDVELLARIKRLLDAGMSLVAVRAAVRDGAIPDVLRLPGGVELRLVIEDPLPFASTP